MKNQIKLLVVACALSFAASIAQADESAAVTVRYSEPGGSTAAGAAALYSRIKTAAQVVCSELDPGRELTRVQPYNDCVHAAMENGVGKIGLPALTAYAAAHGVMASEDRVTIARNR